MSRRTSRTILAAVLLCFGLAAAQDAGQDAPQTEAPQTEAPEGGAQAAQDAAQDTEEPDERTVEGPPPALASFGISAGFPSYQTIAPAVSLQSGHFGVQFKASWTPAGPYVGVQLRGYPAVSLPVPVFAGVGAGFYGSDISYHAAVGAHVPLGLSLRLDLEAGVAFVPFLAERRAAPHLVAGLSYAIPVETGVGGGVPSGRRAVTSTCTEPTDPDSAALSDAVERVIDEWILSARATYGSVYTDLSYSYRVVSSSVNGDVGEVQITYSGSVREIATGQRHSASGRASATFRWNGCGWSNTGVSY